MRENSNLGAPSTVMTFLFVRDVALSTDCEKRLETATLLPSRVVYLLLCCLCEASFHRLPYNTIQYNKSLL